MKRVLKVFAAVCAVCTARVAFAGETDDLLRRWCDGLVALQVREFSRPELKGAVQCPACGLLHGRICDVVYPFAYLYVTTRDRKYLDADACDHVTVKGNVATIVRGGKSLLLESSAPLAIAAGSRGDRIWSPVAGVMCVPLAVSLERPATLKLTGTGEG